MFACVMISSVLMHNFFIDRILMNCYKISIVVCLFVCLSVCLSVCLFVRSLLRKLKWIVESKFAFANMFVSLIYGVNIESKQIHKT